MSKIPLTLEWFSGYAAGSALVFMDIQNVNLHGKTVILSKEFYGGDEECRKFFCEDGFGCSPTAKGTATIWHFC
jgi:hypothetical protein